MIDFKEDEKLSVLNHSCAHVMAQAIKHLYPQAKFWVGPVVSEGFYYDVDLGNAVIKDEDIPKIEKEMKKICDPFGVPIDVIPMQDYGMCNGKGVLEFALSLIEKKDGGC